MFYSQDILQKRGGKFGIIWIAATEAVRLSRRDYARVNIRRSCEDIIAYICLQAQPIRQGGARPRLSLYLSSKLMYGVVKVFNKHHDYLLREVTTLSRGFWSMASTVEIDLRSAAKSDHVTCTPDLMVINDMPLVNPEFGDLCSPQVANLSELAEIEYVRFESPHPRTMNTSSDGGSVVSEPKDKLKAPSLVFSPVLGSPHQTTIDRITLEEEPFPERPMEELITAGQELPAMQLQDLVSLTEPTEDPFTVNVSPIKRAKLSRLSDSRSILEDSISNLARVVIQSMSGDQQEVVQTSAEIEDALPPAEETPVIFPDPESFSPIQKQPPRGEDITVLPTEEKKTRKPKRKRESFTLDLIPMLESPEKRSRPRRQLLFHIDGVTQIPREVLKNQLVNGGDTTRLVELAGNPLPKSSELFIKPSRKDLSHSRLVPIWKKNAFTKLNEGDPELLKPSWCVPKLGETSSSSGSDQELQFQQMPEHHLGEQPLHEETPRQLEVLMEEVLPMESVGAMDTLGVSGMESVELARDVSMDRSRSSRLHVPMDSLTRSRLENVSMSEDESLHRPGSISGRDAPLHDFAGEVSLGILAEVPEEQVEEVAAQLLPKGLGDAEDMFLSEVQKHCAGSGPCTFREVCPPMHTSTENAAATFTVLLERVACGLLKVYQDQPYGEIIISRAP